jgi:uncharacterized protein YacL
MSELKEAETLVEWLKQVFSDSNIAKSWKVVRNIAGIIVGIGSILLSPTLSPFVLSAIAIKWISFLIAICNLLVLGAQSNTSKDKNVKSLFKYLKDVRYRAIKKRHCSDSSYSEKC